MRRQFFVVLATASITACGSFAGETSPSPAPSIPDDGGEDASLMPTTDAGGPDGSIPDARPDASSIGCADGKPHDFCTSFDDGPLADHWQPLFTGTGTASLSKDFNPPTAPNALFSGIAVGMNADGNAGREFLLVPGVRPSTTWQTPTTVAFSFHVEQSDTADHGAVIASILLGEDGGGPDRISLGLGSPTPDKSTSDLYVWETLYSGNQAQIPVIRATNQQVTNGQWHKVVLSVSARGSNAPGTISVSSGGPAEVFTLNSKSVTKDGKLELGAAASPSGATWRVRFDDVMVDWSH